MPVSQRKIAQRTKFFSWLNEPTNLFAKRAIKAPVVNIRIRSLGHSIPGVDVTSTRSRGREECEMRKSLRGRYLRECSSGLAPSHSTMTNVGQLLSLQRPY